MIARRTFLVWGLTAGALILAAVGLALSLGPEAESGAGGSSASKGPADRGPAEAAAPEQAGPASRESDLTRVGTERRLLDESLPAAVGETVVFRGRLVVAGSGRAPKPALICARTGREELDSAWIIAAVGGRVAFDELRAAGEIELRQREEGMTRTTFRANSREDGTFEIRVPKAAARFYLDVKCNDAALTHPVWYGITPENLSRRVDVHMTEAGSIEGSLADASGAPLGPGWVSVLSERYDSPRAPRFQQDRYVPVDRTGKFTVPGLAPGNVNVSALAAGRAAAHEAGVKIEAGKSSRVELVLTPEVPLEGRVVDRDGRGVANKVVRLYPRNGPFIAGIGFGIARSDDEGRLRWTNLFAGTYVSRLVAPGHRVYDNLSMLDVPLAAGSEMPRWVIGPGHFVAGRAVHADGSPAAGAQVWGSASSGDVVKADPSRSAGASTRADATGAFRLEGLPEGPLAVTVQAERHSRAVETNVAHDTEGLVVKLPPKTGVSGRVVDAATDQPVKAFAVKGVRAEDAARYGGIYFGFGGEAELPVVSEAGTFEYGGLTPGTFHFRVMADGFAPFDVKDVVVKSGELTPGLSFRLEASTRVAGKVVEAGTDRPIVGARIEFVSLDAVEMGIRDPGAPTRSDGTFELEAPPDGRGRLHASHSLYTEARTEAFDLRRGERVVIPTIELGRGGSATGIAIDRSGAIAARARVDAYFSGQVNPYPRNAYRDVRSDAKGSFRIEGLIAGEWTVMVHPDGNYEGLNGENTTVSGKVTIVDGQTSVVTFKRPKGGGCTVYGRVTRGGNPLTNGHINLWRDSNGSSASLDADENQASTQLGSQGQYKFSNLTPGPAQIYVSTWGDESSSFSKSIEIPEAAEYKFDIEMPAGGEIRGRVTSRATGKPIVGIDIHAYGVPEGGAPGSSTQSNATTDSDGRYSLKGLATGSVQVNAGPEPGISRASADTKKFMRSYAQVKVTEGTTVTHDFVLDEGASVVVEVVDENGKPVADAWVQVNPLTPSAGWGGAYASSNELGVATIHGVAPGKARAYCQVQGYPPVNSAEFDAALNSTARTRIALVRGVDIVLRILGPDGALLQPFWISLHGEGGVDGGSAHRGNPGQPADGSLKLTVVPGAYKAQIGLADMQNAQADVNIGSKSGSTIDVKLEKLPEKLEKKK